MNTLIDGFGVTDALLSGTGRGWLTNEYDREKLFRECNPVITYVYHVQNDKVSCLMKLPVLIGIQVSIELSNFCSSW